MFQLKGRGETFRLALIVIGTLVFTMLFIGCRAGAEQSLTPTPTSQGVGVREVILVTTTSTYDSGLLDVLLPDFQKRTSYLVKPIAVGSGKALAMASRGEADVLLVHSPEAEEDFMRAANGIDRRLVMHNDFVLVGPPDDPAGIKETRDVAEAFSKIASAQAIFLSRGDDSGTHNKEKEIWARAGISPSGRWYQESGQGMGETLAIASEKEAYTLADRGTYLTLRKRLRMEVLVEGDPTLKNIYHVIQVNPLKFSWVNGPGGKALVEYMVSPEAQGLIGSFGVEKYGQPLFIPDARKAEGLR